MTARPKVMLAMAPDLPARLFDAAARTALTEACEVNFTQPVSDFRLVSDAELRSVEVLITGWESPRVDAAVLDRLTALRGIAHAGGSVKGHLDEACWERGVLVCGAADANALPVAEYAVATILLAAKGVFRAQAIYRQRRGRIDQRTEFADGGSYRRTVGLVGASRIGRRVLELLQPYDLDLRLHDPLLSDAAAQALGARTMDLDDLLGVSQVVSLHAPLIPATRHLIDRERLTRLPDGATLINTARGALVDHAALVAELVSGRISAVLDTTDPFEPLEAGSPLFDLPNVVLTPHVAGALGSELLRLGDSAVRSVLDLLAGRSPYGLVLRDQLASLA